MTGKTCTVNEDGEGEGEGEGEGATHPNHVTSDTLDVLTQHFAALLTTKIDENY